MCEHNQASFYVEFDVLARREQVSIGKVLYHVVLYKGALCMLLYNRKLNVY